MRLYRQILRPAAPAALFVFLLLVTGACAASVTGTLSVASVPEGASLYLDGTLLGSTPFTGIVAAGNHELVLSHDGYEDYTATVTVPENGNVQGNYTLVQASRVSVNAAGPSTGVLSLSSDPSGATVTLDGAVVGTTPLTLRSVAAGDHTVLITYAGYADMTSTITVPAGGTFTNSYTLSCNVLVVSSTPSGASVTVDGTLSGTTPLSLRAVTAGVHTVVLTLDGYTPFTTTVTVPPGQTVQAAYTLAAAGTPAVTATVTTAAPAWTSRPPASRPTPKPVTTTATSPAACTRYYTGMASPGVSHEGRLNCTAVITSNDKMVTLTIPGGTRVTVPAGGNDTISITTLLSSQLPSPVNGGLIPTGYAAAFGPDGTTFDQPATVMFTLDQASWDLFSKSNLTIAATSASGWDVLPTTPDPATRSVSAPVQHFSTIGLFTTAPLEAPAVPSVKDTIRDVVAPANATLPLSPYLPAAAAPVTAVAAGVALSLAGTLAAGSSFVSRNGDQLMELLKGFFGWESTALASETEVDKCSIAPAENLSGVLFCITAREIVVICASILGFVVAFLLQARLSIEITTLVIFVCAGGIATILYDLACKIQAYRVGCRTEYQFWTLGTATMFVTAWLLGSAFAKPSRTIVSEGKKILTPWESVSVKLAGPLAGLFVALLSLALLPLGGLFAVAGAAGFAMNLVNSVFALVPVRPNEGVEIFAWNKAVWALLFFPMIAVYLYIYM